MSGRKWSRSIREWKKVFGKSSKSERRCTRSIREWKEVFGKCWRNGRRFSGSDCRVEGCVETDLEK